jgi:hypothetical protein
MKKYIYLALFSLIIFSCKKQDQQHISSNNNQDQTYLVNVKAYLKTSLYDTDYVKVDFNNSVLSKQGQDWFLRIAFLNRKLSRDFILLQTDSLGNCSQGKFVHIRRDSSNMKTFNGKISVASFQHVASIKKVIDNSVASVDCVVAEEELDADDCASLVVPDCTGCLPEVIVVGYINSGGGGGGGGISYSDYLSLSNLISASGSSASGGSSGVYSPILVPGAPAPAKPSPDLVINYEADAAKPGIDVNAFMKCFSAIPDAGSTCSVTVYTDLPVDDNPSYIFNILSGATGHCFMQLTKTNGTQSVTQIIGKTTSKALAVLGFPVAGKIVDNTAHKYNASITMNITPAQLQTEINAVVAAGSNPSYNMWENNCVNYAVGIMNLLRPTNPLEVGLSLDPSSDESYETPQGLYIALDKLKAAKGPDAANITMDVIQHVGTSHGPCN